MLELTATPERLDVAQFGLSAAAPRTDVERAASGPRSGYRVLMVAPTSFFADYGCHVRILEEARTLQRLGHKVTIATYQNGRDVPGLDVRRTLPIPWRRGYEVGSSRHKVAFDALLALRVLPLAATVRPDIVHGHLHEGALVGGTLARIIRRPLVFDFQGSLSGEMVDHGFVRLGGRKHRLTRRIERRIDHMADAILTSSKGAVRLLTEDFGVPGARITPLPDCVDTTAFRPGVLAQDAAAALRASLGIPPDRELVVYLGLLAPYQGTDHLIQAAASIVRARPTAHCLIMGFPGTDVYAAKAAAAGIGANVTFTGRIPYESAPHMLSLGRVAVAPKLSATEGSGKVLTYMAMGLPVVAFDTPVSHDYLGEDGTYAPAGDADALASRVLELLETPSLSRTFGERLRARAEAEFGWDRAGRTILDVYAALATAPLRDQG